MTSIELSNLRQEEKVLGNILLKMKDQLNRLKVEELALMSRIRADTEEDKTVSGTEETPIKTPLVKQEGASQIPQISEMQSDHEHDEEDVEEVNQEVLDLDLNALGTGKNYDYEEDDEEYIEEDDEEEPAIQDQLSAFMKQLQDQQR